MIIDNNEFELWHQEKVVIQKDKLRPHFHEREIWFSSLGLNIGFEQNGKGKRFLRPVLVFKKFNNEICWCLPLTRTKRTGKYYFSFMFNNTNSNVVLSQIRLLDGKRLEYKIGDIDKATFNLLKDKFVELIE
jgi:mRNA-degrading endonuclease toxin of MazEF toxin-antitoxin module